MGKLRQARKRQCHNLKDFLREETAETKLLFLISSLMACAGDLDVSVRLKSTACICQHRNDFAGRMVSTLRKELEAQGEPLSWIQLINQCILNMDSLERDLKEVGRQMR